MSNSCAVPWRLVDPKNHKRSCLNRATDGGADVVVRDERRRRHCTRRFEFVGEIGALQRFRTPAGVEAAAAYELPPVRGTMFNTGPPVSVSPSAPATVTEISCEFRESEK